MKCPTHDCPIQTIAIPIDEVLGTMAPALRVKDSGPEPPGPAGQLLGGWYINLWLMRLKHWRFKYIGKAGAGIDHTAEGLQEVGSDLGPLSKTMSFGTHASGLRALVQALWWYWQWGVLREPPDGLYL